MTSFKIQKLLRSSFVRTPLAELTPEHGRIMEGSCKAREVEARHPGALRCGLSTMHLERRKATEPVLSNEPRCYLK